jgi:hypothetical protein
MLTILTLCGVLGLAACGRKTDLDPPGITAAPPSEQGAPPTWGQAAPPGEAPPAPPANAPNRSFPLDPLLN